MQATKLNQLLNALSYSRYAKEYTSSIVMENMMGEGKGSTSVPGKHRTLLDGLALLLIDKAHSNVAAVSIRRTKDEVLVLYAMNKDAAAARAHVVEEVVNIANGILDAEPLDIEVYRRQLVAVAPRYCQQKMERRRAKLFKAWSGDYMSGQVELPVPSADDIAQFLKNEPPVDPLLKPSTWGAWVSQWFQTSVSRPFFQSDGGSPPPTREELTDVLIISRSVAALLSEKAACLLRRLRRLGRYMEAVIKISKSAKLERNRSKGSVRFRSEMVGSESSIEISGLVDPLDTFNEIWKSNPTLAKEPLTNAHFKGTNGKYWTIDLEEHKRTATVYTHCEVTVALHLLQLSPKQREIELGVSKACCWPCVLLLELLSKRADVKIIVSGTHSKTYGGWQFPAGLPVELREPIRLDLMSRAREQLEEFPQALDSMLRRASDSQYHSSGESGDSDEEVGYNRMNKGAT